jgi:hypothetical protein
MMEKGVIERAAMALDNAMMDAIHELRTNGDGPYPDDFRAGVRAVLEAIREPSDAMIHATERFVVYDPDTEGLNEHSDDLWKAMIDAALAETP